MSYKTVLEAIARKKKLCQLMLFAGGRPKSRKQADDPKAKDFWNAVKFGEPDRVKTLLVEDPSLSNMDCEMYNYHSGLKPLHLAVYAEAGIYPNKQLIGDKVMKVIFATGGIDSNRRDDMGNTPMHLAIIDHNYWSTLGMVKVLIENGADVNAKNKNGETPLHQAATKGREDIVKCLFENGANPNVKNRQRQTPLHVLALFAGSWRDGTSGTELGKLFVSNGANLSLTDRRRRTPKRYLEDKAKHFHRKPRTTADFQIACLLEAIGG